MTRVSACLLAGAGLLAAACGPKTYVDVQAAAEIAGKAGDYKKVHELCGRAIGLADQLQRGHWVIWSLECYADAASRLGNAGVPASAYAIAVEGYPDYPWQTRSQYRLSNDYGVALSMAGKDDKAISVLEGVLAHYKGTPLEKSINVWERMYIVRNLGKVHAKKGASEASTAFANKWADEIEAMIARDPRVEFRVGAAAALEVLADLLSTHDAVRAARLRVLAGEERRREEFHWAYSTNKARKRCHDMFLFEKRVDRCFLELT